MSTTVELPVNHILAVAPDVAGYIHDMTRKRRVSISTLNDAMAMESTTSSAPNVAAKVNSATTKTFYACPSGHVEILLHKQLNIYGLLDNGSEVLMIPRRVHERLELFIEH